MDRFINPPDRLAAAAKALHLHRTTLYYRMDRIRELGWHVVLHLDAPDIAPLSNMIRKLPVPFVIDHMGRVPAGQGVVEGNEIPYRPEALVKKLRLDGSAVEVEVKAAPFTYRGRQGSLVVARDITDRRRAEEELAKTNAELEKFVLVASHDLQEPLRTTANAALLLDQAHGGKLDGEAKELLGFIVSGVTRYVTVNRYLPVTAGGQSAYAAFGFTMTATGAVRNHFQNSSNELWVALAEKAYAQLNESGVIDQDGTNTYEGIAGGQTGKAFGHIKRQQAGVDAQVIDMDSQAVAEIGLVVREDEKVPHARGFPRAEHVLSGLFRERVGHTPRVGKERPLQVAQPEDPEVPVQIADQHVAVLRCGQSRGGYRASNTQADTGAECCRRLSVSAAIIQSDFGGTRHRPSDSICYTPRTSPSGRGRHMVRPPRVC